MIQQSPTERAACPFCGNSHVQLTLIRDGYEAWCKCGASMTAHNPDSRNKVIAKWNARAALASQAAQPAEADGVERMALRAIKAVTATTKDAVAGLSRIMAITGSAGVSEQYSELMADPNVALIVSEPRAKWAHLFKPGTSGCAVPPDGWRCSRERGHEGPCAATPKAPATDAGEVERLGAIIKDRLGMTNRAAEACTDAARLVLAALATPPAPNDDLRADIAAALPGIAAMVEHLERWHETGAVAGPDESRLLYEGLRASLAALKENRRG